MWLCQTVEFIATAVPRALLNPRDPSLLGVVQSYTGFCAAQASVLMPSP